MPRLEANLPDEEVGEFVLDHDYGEPELEVLGLPSNFDMTSYEKYDLHVMATIEHQMRKAIVYDLLDAVRVSIKHHKVFFQEKDNIAQGQAANTRANAIIEHAKEKTCKLAERYNNNQGWLVKLGV